MKKYTCQKNNKITCLPEAHSRHSERSVPCGHPDSYGSPSACLRLKQESTCHENNKIERHPEFISGSVPFAQSTNEQAQSENLSEIVQSDHPQDIQMLKQVQHDGYSLSNTLTKWAKTAAISLALSFFITAPVMAQDPVTVPTDNYAYTLTKVEEAGVNTITKYEWSDTENKYNPVYYRVDLKQTDYGYPEIADDTKTFTVTTPNTDGSGNAFEYEIKYYVDNSRLAPDRITTEQNGIDINNDFVGLNVTTSSSATGGAIYNYAATSVSQATIGNITGDFIGNYTSSTNDTAFGGAIYNYGSSSEIGDLTGDFIGNYASSTNSYVRGGAIYNHFGTIGDITGDFIGNYASSNYDHTSGGAIYNYDGAIGDIMGDFIGNYAASSDSSFGGAISNQGGTTIASISGSFIGNYAVGYNVRGGAITNIGNIGNITGDFIGNYASSTDSYAKGGAIYHEGINAKIGDIIGDFIGNYASSTDSYAEGGAIYNYGTIGDITGDFIGNYASSTNSYAEGGAIYNYYGTIGDVTGDFIGNYASSTGNFAYGGAIYNYYYSKIGALDDAFHLVGGIYGSFINNYAKTESDSQLALGGAIYTTSDMNFIADNQINYFSGNYTEDHRGKINNAIFVRTSASSSPTIKLQAQNNGVIVFDDQIDGGVSKQNSETGKYEIDHTNAYNLALDGDSTGKVILNNDVINANISLDNTNLYLGREDVFDKSVSLSLNSGSIYLNNNAIGTMHVPTLNLNGNTNISVDADLANKSMDRITADTYNVKDNAMLNVNNVVLLSDAKEDKTDILFADKELASNVAFTGATPIAYSPIWKYDVSYNPDDGFFTFSRGTSGTGGNASDAFNPSVLASPVATQAGAYTTQLQTFNYAFQHADTFMNIPYLERVAIINQGKYALSPTGDATDVGTYSPLMIKQHDPGFWVKPYASFENVPLKNGPKVSNINYGTLIGYDSPLKSISNGFERVLTGYIGYNGASQRYSGVDAYQNGGLLGGTATFYKGNFFNATTLSVGATAGDATTMYGSENYTMLLAGIGNKTGYNFEFFNGGMILQPSMLISYTFVNTFDYTNGAGVRIESDPLHAIQLSPGLKLIGNTKNGWQPYIGVNMVWNLLDDSKVTANDVRLPEMSIKPYVQYGVGIQKRFKDRFLAFGQAMIHNGGRNGVSLTAGLRWKVGKE